MKKNEIKSGVMQPAVPTSNKTRLSFEEGQKKIEYMKARDSEMVTGVFKNLENPARDGRRGAICLGFKKYKGDIDFYEFWDGERYCIPRGLAQHLNSGCFYKEYEVLKHEAFQGIRQGFNPEGKMITSTPHIAKNIYRFAFHSLEYLDDNDDMYPSNLVEVKLA